MTTDSTLGIGVIGCGYWGPKLVRNFARLEDVEVVTVCDSQRARAAQMAREYHIGSVAQRAEDLIQDPRVHLVIVATPSYSHYELAKRAIDAGKHVIVTKPLTTRVEHAEELVDLAERRGVVLAVDHTFVYTGAVQRIRDLVRAGELGDIYYVDSVRINLGLFQSDVNVMWDLAPHDISIIDFVLGGPTVTEVSAIAACHAGSRTENIAYITMRYGSGILAHVHVNWLAPAKVRRTIIGGSRRMIVYDDMEPSEKLRIYDAGVTITPALSQDEIHGQVVVYRAGDMWVPKVDTREALAVQAEHVVECVRSGARPLADGRAGLRVVQVLELAQNALVRGSVGAERGADERVAGAGTGRL